MKKTIILPFVLFFVLIASAVACVRSIPQSCGADLTSMEREAIDRVKKTIFIQDSKSGLVFVFTPYRDCRDYKTTVSVVPVSSVLPDAISITVGDCQRGNR